jgi:DNA mismatch endonuclease, patch repair protein
MRAVKSKNTGPEILVRRALHRMGLRFRIHRRDLPGRPDIVLPKYQTAVFVNGCFWHGHRGCARAELPKSNSEFWKDKIRQNGLRDRRAYVALRKKGWQVLVLWQCQIKNIGAATAKLETALKRVIKAQVSGPSRKSARPSIQR